MSRIDFSHLKANVDRVSASEYNRLVDLVAAMASALFREGIYFSGMGFATRQTAGGGNAVYMLETQENAPADTVISCKRTYFNGVTWSSSGDAFDVNMTHDDKTTGVNFNAVIPRLVSGDILPAFKVAGEWYFTTTFQRTVDCDCYETP